MDRSPRLRALALAAFALALASSARPAAAQDCAATFVPPPHELNVCERLVRELTVERLVPREIEQCRSGPTCVFQPECCVPGACMAIPHCVVTETIEEVVRTVYHRGDLYCDPHELAPRELLEAFLQERLIDPDSGAVADPLAVGVEGLTNAFTWGEQLMRCRGERLPEPIVQLVLDIIRDLPGVGFSPADVRALRLIERDGFPSNVFLREGYGAITLRSSVIIRPDRYAALMGAHGFYTLDDLVQQRVPWVFLRAIDTLIHELVHVRQYREQGERDFLTIYLQQMALQGYDHAPLEDEAYGWASDVAHHTGGFYCLDLVRRYDLEGEERDQDLDVRACTLPAALIEIL